MDTSLKPIAKALISVSGKTGLAEFARALTKYNIVRTSAGGTAKLPGETGLTIR